MKQWSQKRGMQPSECLSPRPRRLRTLPARGKATGRVGPARSPSLVPHWFPKFPRHFLPTPRLALAITSLNGGAGESCGALRGFLQPPGSPPGMSGTQPEDVSPPCRNWTSSPELNETREPFLNPSADYDDEEFLRYLWKEYLHPKEYEWALIAGYIVVFIVALVGNVLGESGSRSLPNLPSLAGRFLLSRLQTAGNRAAGKGLRAPGRVGARRDRPGRAAAGSVAVRRARC